MDGCCNRESCSSWRKQKDEDGDEEKNMSSSEYQIFYDCSSDRDRKCKHKRNKPQMNMNTVFNNMDNPDQFRKTLSEITMLTQSILKTLETSSGTRKIRRSASERKHCNCGLDKARDVHLERIAILADKFLKTFIEPCGDHIDQPRKHCDQCNSRCNKHYRKNSSNLERLPLIIPFKPIELVVPIKVNSGKILRTSQDTERPKFPIKVSNTETHTIYARNCYSREELKESSSDLFLSLREDTSYFSCDDTEWIMENYCSCESFERVSGAKLISDEKKMKITNITKPPCSTLSICVCMICKRPIDYCRCNKASISQTVAKRPETEEIAFKGSCDDQTESQENQKLTLTNVMDDFEEAKVDSPSSFTKCKKCGRTECMCKGSKPTLGSTPFIEKDYTPISRLCSKCGKEKCICKASNPQILETPQHVCNICGNPIQKCICEKPQTSKTYKMDEGTEINLCKHCGNTLDKCFCEQPQTSKSCDFKSGLRSDVLLDLCMCNKSLAPDPDLIAKICGKCGKSNEKCSCEKPQSSKGTPSHLSICKCGSTLIRRLSSESSSRKFKTVTTPIVCQCGFKPERCKCKKPSATIVSSKCGLTKDKCVCIKDISRHTCGKCGKALENCICKAKPQTKETAKKCVCGLPKPPAPVLCNRCGEPLEKCICKKAQSTQTVEVTPVEVISKDRCTKCGKYPCVCPSYSSQGTQTDFKPIIIKPLCEICGKELENCYCKNARSTQTEKPETVYFICEKCDAKKYVGPGQQPEPCECGKEIISNEKELQKLLDIDKELLEEDILRCACDLKEPQIEEPPKPEPPPKPPRKTYRLVFPQHKDIDICRKCRFEPSPLIDQDGRVFCPGNCGCCLCPWKPRATHSLEDTLKHTKFKICKCRTRGSIFTQFTITDSECSQVSYFDACPCREKAEAKHLQLYGYEMWDMSEKLIQKFRGEEVYLRDVREIVPTKLPSKRYLTTTKDHNAQTDLDRDYEDLDDNTYFNESQLPAQQPISNVSNTSDLTCSCKTVISNVDPYSTYEPCEQQECCVHDEKAQEAEQIYAPKPKTCQRQQPIYPSKYTRKIVMASEISTTSTTPSSIQIGCTCDKSTTTSESQLDNYPVHLCLRMSKNITKLPPQQQYRKEQEMTDVVPWCGCLQNNSALVCADDEQYFSCDSDSSTEEGYGEALEPCHFPPPCASNQVTDRNLYILKLLREIVNLIHDDSPIREEAVRIANKQPMTTSESKFSAPAASRICPAPHPLEPLGIFRPGKETKNPDYVCVTVDPQTMLPEPTKSDACKRSYKSFPPEPIMPKYRSDEGPLCICPQQTDICPTHGLITDVLKNTEDECTCEEEIKMEIPKDASSKTKTVSDYLDENECTCLEEMEGHLEENECTCLEEMVGHIEENLGENLEEILAENLDENLEENLEEILGENLEDNLGENLEENLEDEDLLCICPTEDDVCPVHGTRIAPIQSKIKKPCDEPDKNIEPYDPCSNFKEYKIYSLPDALLEKQPPIWGAKQKESEEDIFPDVGCDCDDDDTLDEKVKDESKLLCEEEEQMNIKDDSNVYDEGEEEQTKAKDESKLYNEEEEDECRLETIPETEEQCDLTYDSQAQGATGAGDEPCSFDEDLDCEEFEEECELLKELMAECRKKRGKDGESKEGECDCCHCRAQRSGQNQCTAMATTQQAMGPVDDELKYFIDSLIVDLEAMQHARRKCLAQANICMPKPATCSRESFPVTITDVIELGNRSLYVKWKIHECCGIAGYEIFLDGYLTNRYYHSRHEAAVITDVDVTIPHKIALVAQASNDDDSIALFCQELKNTHKCKSLPWKTDCYKEKPTCPPPPSALWIPSIYMYDPLDCKESPPFRKSLI